MKTLEKARGAGHMMAAWAVQSAARTAKASAATVAVAVAVAVVFAFSVILCANVN